MPKGQPLKRDLFTYLRGQAHNRLQNVFDENGFFADFLSPISEQDAYEMASLTVDARDERARIIVDGIPIYGGLPRNSDCTALGEPVQITQKMEHVRICPEQETVQPFRVAHAPNGTLIATINLYRLFLLLPVGLSVVQRWSERSFQPIYTLIHISRKRSGGHTVVWKTTDN